MKNSSGSYQTSYPMKGITFIELLVTMAVALIILVLAVPYLKEVIMNNRLMSQRDALINTLNYARATALTQNISVQVCPVGATASTTCGNSWQSGWMVVTQPTTGRPVLLQSNRAGANSPILSIVPISGVSASSITFDPRGLTTTQANLKICDSRGSAYALSIGVLASGFVQTSAKKGMASWDGGVLTCP
jgi:type IV fimbrial biogenesis protein FimT